jgi:hypothetical protein
MRDLTSGNPDLALVALRYAADELTPAETELFEARLAVDQEAREALGEAVRLSAVASGVPAPTPDPLFRDAARERLHPTWAARLFPRRPYRGHPLAWAGVGGAIAAVVSVAVTHLTAESAAGTPPAISACDPPADLPTGPSRRVALDPHNNPMLNPMGMTDRSPVAGPLLPKLPTDTPAASTVPTPMPSADPRAEGTADQTDPMVNTEAGTKKG